jgi:23S rRNA (pseudouridine1915-N3)-methyltransferase
MKIKIITVGSPKHDFVKNAVIHFQKHLKKYTSVTIDEIKPEKIMPHKLKTTILENEANAILKRITPSDYIIVLDDAGKELSSREFSLFLTESSNRSIKYLTFIIGGPFGLDQSIKEAARMKLSLSKMTFSHETILPILLEQLYRAFAILHNEPFAKY